MAPPENPGETSGGDSATPPPAVAGTPGGHVEVGAHTSDEPPETSGGSTLGTGPAVAATPGGHTDVEPHTSGGPEEAAQGSTLAPPVVAATPATTEGPGLTSGSDTVLPSVSANPAQDATLTETPTRGGSVSGSRTGALPEVAATPDPLKYKPAGTS